MHERHTRTTVTCNTFYGKTTANKEHVKVRRDNNEREESEKKKKSSRVRRD